MDMHGHDSMKVDNDSSELGDNSSQLSDAFSKIRENSIAICLAVLDLYEDSGDTTYLDAAVNSVRGALVMKPLDVDLRFQLGRLLNARFKRFGSNDDINEAISILRHILDLTLDDDPDKPSLLNNLSVYLQNRFERLGDLGDLEAAILVHRSAVELTPDEHIRKPAQLSNLGNALQSRFERVRELGDLEAAISAKRSAVELTLDGHPDKPMYLNNLGTSFRSYFELVGELGDLEAAISVQRRAVDLTPDGYTNKPVYMNNLGNSLRDRFERVGELGDLEDAIAMHRRAVELTPDGHPDRPARMNNLGISLQIRFDRVGELDDLEAAISVKCSAVDLTPDGHPDKSGRMNNLGTAFRRRFERVGELGDLEAAVAVHRRAVEHTSDGHPDRPMYMDNLGNALQNRFERKGELGDLEAAISVQHRAIELTPESHPNKPKYTNNLGISLQSRFERVGELGDLEAAISVQRRAVELSPDDHPNKATYMNNLGTALQIRFERLDELEDLDAVVSVMRRAVELTPDDHPDKPARMSNLGNALERRFRSVGELGDLEAAISLQRRAVDLTPDGHLDKPMYANNLGHALHSRFKRVGALVDVDAAISVHYRAVELTPEGHINKVLCMNNLGFSLMSRFQRTLIHSDFQAAYKCFLDATDQASGLPSERFASARLCVLLLMMHREHGSAGALFLAQSNVLRLLPEVVWLGHSIHRRYEESAKLAGPVSAAVANAIEHEWLPQAVEWLEEGRSLIWSQILGLRSPLDELELHHAELSRRLRIIRQQLQQSGHIPRSLESVNLHETTGFTPNVALDKHRGLTIEYGQLLSEVRSCAGFEDFLRPKPFSALLPSMAELGDRYIVFMNVHQTRCDALILTPSGVVTPVALPGLSLERADQLQLLWIEHLRSRRIRMRGLESLGMDIEIDSTLPKLGSESTETRHSSRVPLEHGSTDHLLEHTWNWIVEPVLKALGLTKSVPSGSLPHITWCPTGPLTRIPLHAAGVYSNPNGPRVFNYVVSSYTPTLSALLRSSQGITSPSVAPSVLVVTQPATPGQPALPGTVDECQRLERLLGEADIEKKILDGEQATTGAIRASIDKHSWVHLACHGSQHTGDATQSAFHLYDGPLALSDLMQTVSDKAELAFLSACQTATGDRNNPEESVHLAAGMLAVGFKGVVATMWSIGDRDAPIVVEAYYKKLLELRRMGAVGRGQTGAAYALHEAVKVLRDEVGEENFLSWAPFVHFGA